MAGPRIALVGATGAVGTEMRRLLEVRDFPIEGDPIFLASERSAGKRLPFKGREVEVQAINADAFEGVDIAMFSAGGSLSKQWADTAVQAGATVIDNSSAFRMYDEVPLVVSEVNPEALADRPKGIVANPNCTTMVLMVATKPLHAAFGLTDAVVASYQAAGGSGMSGIEELMEQTAKLSAVGEEDLRLNGAQVEASVEADTF